MPERNLVSQFPVKKYANMLTFLALVVVLQSGCSELRQSTLDRNFLGNRQSKPSWTKDPIDSADQYITETHQALDAEAPKDQARILDISDEAIDSDEQLVKLVANPAAFSAGESMEYATDPSEHACDHLSQCDCYKRQLKPKLPHAEPIEPPSITYSVPATAASSTEYTGQVPPTAAVSQPLTPILFDAETRKLQINIDSEETLNSLRRNEPWSYEKPAKVEDKPETSTPSSPDNFSALTNETDDLVRSNNIRDRVSQQMRTANWRESNQSEITRFEPQPPPGCDSCNSAACNGNCETSKRRIQGATLPVLTNSVAEVATNSFEATGEVKAASALDTCPLEDEINGVIELGSDHPETALTMPGNVVVASVASTDPPDSVSTDDSNDEPWTDLWGQADSQRSATLFGRSESACQEPGCSPCQSNECPDTNDGHADPEAGIADLENFPTPQQNDLASSPFQRGLIAVETGDATPIQSEAFPAMPIGVTASPTSSNDFIPAAHEADIPNTEMMNGRPSATDFPASLRGNPAEKDGMLNHAESLVANSIPADEFDTESTEAANEMPRDPDQQPFQEIENGFRHDFIPPAQAEFTSIESPTTVTMPKLPVDPSTIFVPDGSPTPLLNTFNRTLPAESAESTVATDIQEAMLINTTDIPSVENGSEPELDPTLEVNLRLLEVLELQMAQLKESQDELSKSDRQYWQHQLDAIGRVIEDEEFASLNRVRYQAARDTLDRLKESFAKIVSNTNLKVSNGVFCTEITGFGQFKAFPDSIFRPGKRLLIYCEIENYASEVRSSNFHTSLRGSFVIHNPQGRAVQQAQFATVEDVSNTRRQDFYMYFPVQLGDLPPGEYKLDLIVEDILGNKMATLDSGLAFLVE